MRKFTFIFSLVFYLFSGNFSKSFRLFYPLLNISLHLDYNFYNAFNNMRRLINWIKQNSILFVAYICVGIGLLIWGVFLFLIDKTYNISGSLTPEEMAQTGQVGDFIGGVIGSVWALAGVFLYFSALKLQQQELKSQREEMATSQKLLDQQMFEGTFFNLLKAQENIRNSIHAYFYWINIDNYSRIEEIKGEKHGVNFLLLPNLN